jgi:hypothetical protein
LGAYNSQRPRPWPQGIPIIRLLQRHTHCTFSPDIEADAAAQMFRAILDDQRSPFFGDPAMGHNAQTIIKLK